MQLLPQNNLMGHSQIIKDEVRALRLQGFSLGQIQARTKISKSTIHTWIGDIVLSKDQQDLLKGATHTALQKGRIKAQSVQKKRKVSLERELFDKGKSDIGRLDERELFIAGVALYWAEGFKNKHEHRLGFCNSDPSMIKFYLRWLKEALGVSENDLVGRLALNESYKDKTGEIEQYWSEITGISLSNFTKTFYQHTQWKKQYDTDTYHGVLRIHVKNSLKYLLKMRGWIEGLRSNLPG